ncbi:hypothetical protein B5S28_g1155 [[Candida] boidinii]|uniref:Unnamed protein product n=1 Tax=Candida boidinii TaxID=5477 RepID=A0ACB5TXM3_CANBO|nr:hypothetical protein B5S28_g1155 [[Candida] boidinii]GME96897.1 unnamed protein product [[Candida] boidinii]
MSLYPPPTINRIQNRTLEFQQCVSTFTKQNNKYKLAQQQQQQQQQQQLQLQQNGKLGTGSFSEKASLIAKDISRVTASLSKLAILARQKQLFNEQPQDMIKLTYVIKQDIFKIERNIKELQTTMNGSQQSNEPQLRTYSKNVVQLLNTKTKNISEEFKTVLEVRQRNEMLQKTRQEQILSIAKNGGSIGNNDYSSNNISNNTSNNASNNNNNNNNNNNGDEDALIPYALRKKTTSSENPFLSGLTSNRDTDDPDYSVPDAKNQDFLSIPNQSQQMLLLEEQNNQYLQERNHAVESIESTINEVGNLFQQLATMVQEQGEQIQRIDTNIEDTSINIAGAQRELMKYYNHISSNRWLMVKVFGILILFFLLWALIS